MTIFEKGSVILVSFPFSDQQTTKKRPAVIVSSNKYNSNHYDIVALAITSKIEKNEKYIIENWKECGLIKKSVLKPIIFTLEKSLVIKKIGDFTSDDFSKVTK